MLIFILYCNKLRQVPCCISKQKRTMNKQTYQFFYLKTGNGHYAPAKALANELKQKHDSQIEPLLIDGLPAHKTFARRIIIDGYGYSINKAKWAYELLYALHKIKIIAYLSSVIVHFITFRYIEEKILTQKPDSIIILHFFLIKPILKAVKKHNLNINTTIIVTDPFTAHPIWFLQKNQKFIVFSEKLKNDLIIKHAVKEQNINVFPFIIDEKFTVKLSEKEKVAAKQQLGFKNSKKVILIIGGGQGIPNGIKIAKQLAKDNDDAEIAFVCGHNKNLYEKITSLKKAEKLNNITIYGYVDFVYTLINVADLVVTKCGASTFMEILFSEKVQIICNYIWEQEKGNMEYIRNNQMGIYQKKASTISAIAKELLSNHAQYDMIQQNIKRQSLLNGTPLVASYLITQ